MIWTQWTWKPIPRSIGFDADENGHPRQAHPKILIYLYGGLEMAVLRSLLEGRGLSSIGRHEGTLIGLLQTDNTRHDSKGANEKNQRRDEGADAAAAQTGQRRGWGSIWMPAKLINLHVWI
jgi:hypothetical protein